MMMKAGSASTIITNKLGTDIQGATVGGKDRYVRDELEAHSHSLSNDRRETLQETNRGA